MSEVLTLALTNADQSAVMMPKVRSWMEINSWAVSIAANALFLYLLWPLGA